MNEPYYVVLERLNNNKYSWAGVKVSKQKYSARRRGISWELNDWKIQEKIAEATTCELSGRKLVHEISNPDAPSIDRRWNNLGYTDSNSQIVCTVINKMKGEMTVTEFVQRCREIAAYADSVPKV